MTTTERDAFCLAHNLPGWLLFKPEEMAQIQSAHRLMQAEIAAWRRVAFDRFGAKSPGALVVCSDVHKQCAQRMRAYRKGLLDVIERTTEAEVKKIAQEAVNT